MHLFRALLKSRLVWIGAGSSASLGAYSLVSHTNVFHNLSSVLNTTVVYPVKNFVFKPVEIAVKHTMISEYEISEKVKNLNFSIKADESVETEKDLFVVIYQGGKQLILTIKEWFSEFSKFISEKLVPYLQSKPSGEIVEDFESYLEPARHLFSRPNTDRLQSNKTRWEQYKKALKTPEFWSSLPRMNKFFLDFKDELKQLSEAEIAEVVDIYLDNPVEMNEKVSLMMEALKDDPQAKAKFTPKLMMDFVRSENIDELKASLAADKVSRGLTAVFDFLGVSKETSKHPDKKGIDTKKMAEEINNLFTSIASFFA
ncbi:hypothetical protein [Candidatus Mycoplasma haematohominis]|nr:hypothetical protein [Candidatus Mycoplasma haemohominis]